MTDSEIIKALEEAINTYNEKGVFVSTENLQQQALDLLKRQKKELEAIKDKKALVFKLSEEQINEIKEQINETKGGLLKSVEYNERKIKAEAYKEFAEIIKDKWFDNRYDSPNVDFDDFIDDALKELIGENNERNIV